MLGLNKRQPRAFFERRWGSFRRSAKVFKRALRSSPRGANASIESIGAFFFLLSTFCSRYAIIFDMKVITVKNYAELSALAADIICDLIVRNPSATLGLATGSTPLGAYSIMHDRFSRALLSFKHVKVFNLDEYAGLGSDSVNSYAHFMKVNLFDGTDMNIANFHIPCGAAKDLEEECRRYDRLLTANPRNLQLLGLGSNGHIAFNEPSTPFESRTHVVELAKSTIADNSRLFEYDSQVPKKAITMGIADIMASERVLLLASGSNKAQAVLNMIRGEISVNCPASVLQRHRDATVIIDEDAASLL